MDSYSVLLIQVFLNFRKCVMEEKPALEEKVIPLVVENTLFLWASFKMCAYLGLRVMYVHV